VRSVVVLALLLALGFAGTAQVRAAAATVSAPGELRVPLVTATPPMDGDANHPAWAQAATTTYDYDLRLKRKSANSTVAKVMTDGRYLYVAFDAKYNGQLRAEQHTNNVGVDTDDEVQIDLWPSGANGFRYIFIATPLGTHYQFSSENDVYEPEWTSAGRIVPGGFMVTMRIPLNVMKGARTERWNAQFARLTMQTREDLAWNHGENQSDHNDLTYAGVFHNMPVVAATRPKARVAVYGLTEIGSSGSGNSTARAGADISIPITSGSSFIATLHPDFSNVEADQQTIAPTAFQRNYAEVRPFFTQLSQFYNRFNSVGYYVADLYTPSIPTPRNGYAFEGKEGPFTLSALDAVGADARNDSAQSFGYHTPNRKFAVSLQHTGVSLPGVKDDVVSAGIVNDNLRNFFTYLNYGSDKGTYVLDGSQAQRYEAGFGIYGPTSFFGGAIRKLGAYYSPYDGYVQLTDVAGFTFNGSKDFLFKQPGKIRRVSPYVFFDSYHQHDGQLNQYDMEEGVEITTYSNWRLDLNAGSSYLREADGTMSPITQNTFRLVYNDTTATPTLFSWATGRFGPGQLDTWDRSTTLRVGKRGSFTLEVDDTAQYLDIGQRRIQWFERASYAYQLTRESSFAVGIRKVVGQSPILSYQQPEGTNITANYHGKMGPWEFYAAYGSANNISTLHAVTLKVIRYIGAAKGT